MNIYSMAVKVGTFSDELRAWLGVEGVGKVMTNSNFRWYGNLERM